MQIHPRLNLDAHYITEKSIWCMNVVITSLTSWRCVLTRTISCSGIVQVSRFGGSQTSFSCSAIEKFLSYEQKGQHQA
jgi:hypothetical protein